LLVLAYPGCPKKEAIELLLLFFDVCYFDDGDHKAILVNILFVTW